MDRLLEESSPDGVRPPSACLFATDVNYLTPDPQDVLEVRRTNDLSTPSYTYLTQEFKGISDPYETLADER